MSIPTNPMNTPANLLAGNMLLKNIIPVTMVKIGVKAFRKAAKELSILVSAMQNRNAGKKLPSNAESNTSLIFARGIFFICCKPTGNNMMPALRIRTHATWYALSDFIPSFIRINELPQIEQSAINSNQ